MAVDEPLARERAHYCRGEDCFATSSLGILLDVAFFLRRPNESCLSRLHSDTREARLRSIDNSTSRPAYYDVAIMLRAFQGTETAMRSPSNGMLL
jgi:hypothetical protein